MPIREDFSDSAAEPSLTSPPRNSQIHLLIRRRLTRNFLDVLGAAFSGQLVRSMMYFNEKSQLQGLDSEMACTGMLAHIHEVLKTSVAIFFPTLMRGMLSELDYARNTRDIFRIMEIETFEDDDWRGREVLKALTDDTISPEQHRQNTIRRAQHMTQLRNLKAILILRHRAIWLHRPQLEAEDNPQSRQQIPNEQGIRLRSTEVFLRQMEADTNPAHQHLIRMIRPQIKAQALPYLNEHRLIANLRMMRDNLGPQERLVADPRPNLEPPTELNSIETLDQQRYTLYNEVFNHLDDKESSVLCRLMTYARIIRLLLRKRETNSLLGGELTVRTEQLMKEVEGIVVASRTAGQSSTRKAGEQLASEPSQSDVRLRGHSMEQIALSSPVSLARPHLSSRFLERAQMEALQNSTTDSPDPVATDKDSNVASSVPDAASVPGRSPSSSSIIDFRHQPVRE
ncbi:hypothetical protein NHQ30_008614 [Ciborinia camelliae]|nr:hypothetical protein NHQ30_008614 [Ciborinia camelliae]